MTKKNVFIALLLLSLIRMSAQEYEYVPLVREGVRWVYFYDNPFKAEVLDMADSIQYYSFGFKSDTLIDGKYYKPVSLSFISSRGEDIPQNYVPAYLREEDKRVFAIFPDGRWYPQCPVGIGTVVSNTTDFTAPEGELLLYDFNDAANMYSSGYYPAEYRYTDTITIDSYRTCKRHHYKWYEQEDAVIVESIGYGSGGGTPLYYFPWMITGMQVMYNLSHVIEKGKIIYKTEKYNQSDAIKEVTADMKQTLDANYYNMMGVPVGKELPTTTGIYIHQGKKYVVR